MSEIRPATIEDRDAVVALMTRAFHDDPGAIIIEPDPSLRDAEMGAIFHGFVTASVPEATAAQAIGDPPLGVAFWFGPDTHGPSDASLITAASEVGAPILSQTALARFVPMVSELEATHERLMGEAAHLRLDFLAVDPSAQGLGIGGRLVLTGNALADELGLPAYLETFTTPNVRFYERHGYRVIGEHAMATTPHVVWAMRRDPYISAHHWSASTGVCGGQPAISSTCHS